MNAYFQSLPRLFAMLAEAMEPQQRQGDDAAQSRARLLLELEAEMARLDERVHQDQARRNVLRHEIRRLRSTLTVEDRREYEQTSQIDKPAPSLAGPEGAGS